MICRNRTVEKQKYCRSNVWRYSVYLRSICIYMELGERYIYTSYRFRRSTDPKPNKQKENKTWIDHSKTAK